MPDDDNGLIGPGSKKPIKKLSDITPDTPPEDLPDWYRPLRPPFEPGNKMALTHGARSPREVAPLALEILAEAKNRPEWPRYLDDASYTEEIWAWAWAEATCEKLRMFLSNMDVADMLSELGEETETVKMVSQSKQRRRTTSRKQKSALDLLVRWESIASTHRDKLGLTPLSRTKIDRDKAATQLDLATLWSKMPEGEAMEPEPEPPAIEPHVPEKFKGYYYPKSTEKPLTEDNGGSEEVPE